jgi:hypothetical protein
MSRPARSAVQSASDKVVVEKFRLDANDGELDAGGSFNNALTSDASGVKPVPSTCRIARWDISASDWLAIEEGVDGDVFAIAPRRRLPRRT